jgi:alkanesulfonate monooxygenase SsuD/methylene tetrahydromethanopterin reductase-like flavin-dependent oxidoreductase (luciferase family)
MRPFPFGVIVQDSPATIDRLVGFAAALAESGYDSVLLGDPRDVAKPGARATWCGLDVFTVAAHLAVIVKRLRLDVVVNTNYLEPFGLARLLASLDHVSHGRAGWLATIQETERAPFNHQATPSSEATRRLRRAEAVEVIERLIASWDADAFLRNKATGAFVDPARIHTIDHAGRFFSVRGPLNVARPPQGSLPRLAFVDAAESDDDAQHAGADALLLSGFDDDSARALKARLVARGDRPPALIRYVTPIVAGLSQAQAGDGAAGDVWRGLPEDWHRQCDVWQQQGSAWDGLLIAPAAADQFNADMFRALVRQAK